MSGALFGMDDVRQALPAATDEGAVQPDAAGPRRSWWRRLMLGRAAAPAEAPAPAQPLLPTDSPPAPAAAGEPCTPVAEAEDHQRLAAPAAFAESPPAPAALQPRTPWAVRLDPARGAVD